MAPRPRFSFVATSRNDDHGGDILRRTQTFVNCLAEQCERHQVRSELVLVEWNPPRSRAGLENVLAWPAGSEWFSARILTVPPRLHRNLPHSLVLPMFQMIAKNVGIRRTLGDYIIATNVDIIFSDEIFDWMKCAELRDGVVYRADRWDIPNAVQLEPSIDKLLYRARTEAIRRNLKDGTYVKQGDNFVNSTPSHFDSAFYQPLRHKLETLERSFSENPEAYGNDIRLAFEQLLTRIEQLRRNYFIPVLHTNGSGDFTMLSRGDWFALRGYPEWNVFSWWLDSALIYQAYYNSMQVEELDRRLVIYHIEHDYGSGWTPEGAGALWRRLQERGIPCIQEREALAIIYELQDNAAAGQFTLYNDLDWGFYEQEVIPRDVVVEGMPRRPRATANQGPLTEDFRSSLRHITRGLPEGAALAPIDGVRVEFRCHDNGASEICVETRPEPWSFALGFNLSLLARGTREYWVRTSLVVEQGNVGLGVLNADKTAFLVDTRCRGPESKPQEVYCYVKDGVQASELMLRNASSESIPSRFIVKSVELLVDNERHIDAGNQETPPIRIDLSAVVPGSPDAIIRVFQSPSGTQNEHEAARQVMIVTPPERWARAALLDLGSRPHTAEVVSIEFHVLQGSVAIGRLARSTDAILTERCLGAAPPLARVDLKLGDGADVSHLVITNISSLGRSKVLIHNVQYR
jgi:hypothetical protein